MSVGWSPVHISLGQGLWCSAQTRWQCLWVYGSSHDFKFPSSSQTVDAVDLELPECLADVMNHILEFRYSNATKGIYNAIISIFGSWLLSQLPHSVELLLYSGECLQLLLPLCLFLFFPKKTESRFPRKSYYAPEYNFIKEAFQNISYRHRPRPPD